MVEFRGVAQELEGVGNTTHVKLWIETQDEHYKATPTTPHDGQGHKADVHNIALPGQIWVGMYLA